VTPLNQQDGPPYSQSTTCSEDGEGTDYDYDGDCCGITIDEVFADEEDATKQPPLSAEQKLICTPIIRGYSLKDKL